MSIFLGLITSTENVQKNIYCNFCDQQQLHFEEFFYQIPLTWSKTYKGFLIDIKIRISMVYIIFLFLRFNQNVTTYKYVYLQSHHHRFLAGKTASVVATSPACRHCHEAMFYSLNFLIQARQQSCQSYLLWWPCIKIAISCHIFVKFQEKMRQSHKK